MEYDGFWEFLVKQKGFFFPFTQRSICSDAFHIVVEHLQ